MNPSDGLLTQKLVICYLSGLLVPVIDSLVTILAMQLLLCLFFWGKDLLHQLFSENSFDHALMIIVVNPLVVLGATG